MEREEVWSGFDHHRNAEEQQHTSLELSPWEFNLSPSIYPVDQVTHEHKRSRKRGIKDKQTVQKTHKEVNSTDLLVNKKTLNERGCEITRQFKNQVPTNNPDWQDKEITI